jgi:hypothetical protein
MQAILLIRLLDRFRNRGGIFSMPYDPSLRLESQESQEYKPRSREIRLMNRRTLPVEHRQSYPTEIPARSPDQSAPWLPRGPACAKGRHGRLQVRNIGRILCRGGRFSELLHQPSISASSARRNRLQNAHAPQPHSSRSHQCTSSRRPRICAPRWCKSCRLSVPGLPIPETCGWDCRRCLIRGCRRERPGISCRSTIQDVPGSGRVPTRPCWYRYTFLPVDRRSSAIWQPDCPLPASRPSGGDAGLR